MASHVRRLLWNTRERLTSSDLNNAAALQHRALLEGLAAAVSSDTAQFGVVRGLTVSLAGGNMLATIAPGLALVASTPATTYDSSTGWLELRSASSIDLSSYVDGANPRWVCIEVAAADALEAGALVDIFVPASGTFLPTSLDKLRGSAPVITVTAGTAAATPQMPAGVAGRVPLAYVYIPAAAVALNSYDVVGCRPLLRGGRQSTWDTSRARVRGGGVEVMTNGYEVTLHEAEGVFSGSQVPFHIRDALVLDMSVVGGWDAATIPVADGPVYFYACPPPYPSGYDATLARREFVLVSADTAARFPACVPQAGTSQGCIVIASATAPSRNTLSGYVDGTDLDLLCAPWGSSTRTLPGDAMVYLGAGYHSAIDTEFVNQRLVGGDTVYPRGYAGSGDDVPQNELHDGTVWIADGTLVNLWDDGGVCFNFPVTATVVECSVSVSIGTATAYRIEILDNRNQIHEMRGPLGAVIGAISHAFNAVPDDDGNVEFDDATALAATTDLGGANLRSYGYRDCILARR